MLNFSVDKDFKVWHDRAVFHFLTTSTDQDKYRISVLKHLDLDGFLILSTFALSGPDECSSLPVARYDISSLINIFGNEFRVLFSEERIHTTPWGSSQPFTAAVFQRIH